MITTLIKQFIRPYQTIIMAIVIVLALLFVLSKNPLGVFSSTSLVLKETHAIVKEIKSIGQLVTSEYYGEVVESLEGRLAYTEVHYDYLDSAKNLYEEIRVNYNQVYDQYPGRLQKFKRKQVLFADYQDYPENKVYQLIRNTTRKSDKLFLNDIVKSKDWEEFRKSYSTPLKERIGRSFKRKTEKGIKLAYVGRGWVKAGFDFNKLGKEGNPILFEYSTGKDTLFIKNLDPEILETDINPWFIFNDKKKVKGFEVLKAAKNSNITFQDITTVKKACKEKLRQDALFREILEKATVSAEETLSNFIQLLSNGKKITVKIIPTSTYPYKKSLLFDNQIDMEEMRDLQALLLSPDSGAYKALLVELQNANPSITDEAYWQTNILKLSTDSTFFNEGL